MEAGDRWILHIPDLREYSDQLISEKREVRAYRGLLPWEGRGRLNLKSCKEDMPIFLDGNNPYHTFFQKEQEKTCLHLKLDESWMSP
jgi:hypothetical protein